MTHRPHYIGLMSGTSLDAVDAVAVNFHQQKINIVGTHSYSLPDALKQAILELCNGTEDNIRLLADTDHNLGHLYTTTTMELMEKIGLVASQVAAIGCHGQTVRHVPPGQGKIPYSLQIGDANLLTTGTGIPVVADFRRKDMALGGQGAPLVPAFHRQVFSRADKERVIVNIGGIANITYLPKQGECQGFDTGPGNMLMDLWSQIHLGKSYDHNGDWAASGSIDDKLLGHLKSCDFFSLPAPKSTGRELFNRHWLESQLVDFNHLSAVDIQTTLLALTAQTICDSIDGLESSADEVFVCGGGALNSTLMEAMAELLPLASVKTTDDLGIGPTWVEACAFAWLAKQHLENKPGNLPAVTGARRETVLGALYLP
jgi:anhydro-N-acetylmuramic acid kinase